jgi:hypothetical protein
MFYINAIPAAILFDLGATHSFLSARYTNTNELPLQAMKTPMVVMSWLKKAKAVIHCARGTVELTSSKGERFEVEIIVTASTRPAVFLVDEKFVCNNIRVVRDFPDVFLEMLPGMPLDREVEFIIDLLPGTAPISKRPYMMSKEELKEHKK